jgi:hypothetical protein
MMARLILHAARFAFLGLVVVGCTLHQSSEEFPVKGTGNAADHGGYALLFGVLGDEKDVAKLLVIKRERQELRELIQTIAKTAGAAHKQVEEFATADRSLNLTRQGLPPAEGTTRASIAREKGKALLTEGGKEFELQLLLSQSEALTYGSHLAETVAKAEKNPERGKYFQQLASDLRQLQGKVLAMLLAHYNWSKDK